MQEMPDAEFSVIARIIFQILGPTPIGNWREVDWDPDSIILGIKRAKLKKFSDSCAAATFTKGLEVSPYFVDHPGYEGMYLN